MFVTSQQALIDQINAVKAAVLDATGPVHATVKLAQGAFVPTPTSDPTTFTEADFTGYASKTVAAYTPASLEPNGASQILSSAVLDWNPTGTTTTNLVTGYWILGGSGDYLGGESFPTPVPMQSPTDVLNLVVVWQVAKSSWSGQLLL